MVDDRRQAETLQSTLRALAERIDELRSDHNNLEKENRFLQHYIGSLTRTMSAKTERRLKNDRARSTKRAEGHRDGNPVHKSHFHREDKEWVINAETSCANGRKVCHIYEDGTGTTNNVVTTRKGQGGRGRKKENELLTSIAQRKKLSTISITMAFRVCQEPTTDPEGHS
ncbi:hypothetical protein I7I51_06569 [Histoplasma capsulatum]|uniref:Uncharacterized protein n=1 Tax=Ajellomyces capsulatus TaxID=5037 RepID=A0A8A1MI67_AJECA|nr:hypothetical protein I7I51_06569 [Histoplasma capsulatum]